MFKFNVIVSTWVACVSCRRNFCLANIAVARATAYPIPHTAYTARAHVTGRRQALSTFP